VTGYVTRRLLLSLPLLLGAASLVFLLLHLVPGDPARAMLGPGAPEADVDAVRHRLGLDRSLAAQYGSYLGALALGDLGSSLHYQDPVVSLLAQRLPATALLAAATLLLALAAALPAGIAAALRPGGTLDRVSAAIAAVALAMPSFWLGPVLVILFSIRLRWLPVSGADAPGSLVLPAATLAFPIGALLARLLRASLVTEIDAPYIAASRARGLSRGAAVRHALRNALGPVATMTALQTGSLLTGAILTETIFAWPGLGRLLVRAIAYRDYPLVQGGVLLFAVLYLGANLAGDVVRAALDPRLAE
jgi:ABC-type dipeptide/oligopeptide/nickel transport system permease component